MKKNTEKAGDLNFQGGVAPKWFYLRQRKDLSNELQNVQNKQKKSAKNKANSSVLEENNFTFCYNWEAQERVTQWDS